MCKGLLDLMNGLPVLGARSLFFVVRPRPGRSGGQFVENRRFGKRPA